MLDELAILIDQDLLDQVGVVGKHDLPRAEPGRYEVAVLPSPAGKSSQLVAAELLEIAEEPVLWRPGWTRRSQECGHAV